MMTKFKKNLLKQLSVFHLNWLNANASSLTSIQRHNIFLHLQSLKEDYVEISDIHNNNIHVILPSQCFSTFSLPWLPFNMLPFCVTQLSTPLLLFEFILVLCAASLYENFKSIPREISWGPWGSWGPWITIINLLGLC